MLFLEKKSQPNVWTRGNRQNLNRSIHWFSGYEHADSWRGWQLCRWDTDSNVIFSLNFFGSISVDHGARFWNDTRFPSLMAIADSLLCGESVRDLAFVRILQVPFFFPKSWGFLVNCGVWKPRNFLNQRSLFLSFVETSFLNFIHLDNKTTLAVYQKLQCVMARRADAGYQAGLLKSWCLFQKASHASDEIKTIEYITVFINTILPRCRKEL